MTTDHSSTVQVCWTFGTQTTCFLFVCLKLKLFLLGNNLWRDDSVDSEAAGRLSTIHLHWNTYHSWRYSSTYSSNNYSVLFFSIHIAPNHDSSRLMALYIVKNDKIFHYLQHNINILFKFKMNTESNRKAPSVKIEEIIIQSDYMKNLCIRVYVSLISDKYERERWLYMRTAVQILLWGGRTTERTRSCLHSSPVGGSNATTIRYTAVKVAEQGRRKKKEAEDEERRKKFSHHSEVNSRGWYFCYY